MERIAPRQQGNWDWRAAGNFAGGGAGSGLAIFAGVATAVGAPVDRIVFVAAAVLVAGGLSLVGLELGRPLRSVRVFFHVQTSWMTREAFVAPVLILALLATAWFGGVALALMCAILGFAMVYAQARMLGDAKGIPAWREPRLVPFIVATGLAEGSGVFLCFPSSARGFAAGAAFVALLLIVVRWATWRSYRKHLAEGAAPAETLAVLQRFEAPFFVAGTVLPGLLLALASASPWLVEPPVIAAGILTLASGWALKFAIVTRAGFNQGFALPRFRPGWS